MKSTYHAKELLLFTVQLLYWQQVNEVNPSDESRERVDHYLDMVAIQDWLYRYHRGIELFQERFCND